ncbi:hypothetical protein A1O1_03704 [Capronia coronata CBS 617.96]|uniref:Uncharacterized protein n=1 Tax=Capronia coronata CBS 617.96 TaxID=1182541 RepID=W9YMY5_9EURO|nr:uncharacterized protein A1O1_03704 [Capronia coronata CBS 617.96]EXJ90601.1 hypothetical protein A1O1_03704 [Capronia coronata CBS 617.96]
MQGFVQDGPSYFDYTPRRHASSEAETPPSDHISPGSPRRASPGPRPRRGFVRSHSDYEAMHRRIQVQAVLEVQVSHSMTAQGLGLLPESELGPHVAIGRYRTQQSPRVAEASLAESAASAPISPGKVVPTSGSNTKGENPSRTPSRPTMGHGWARSTSGSVWFQMKKSSSDVGGVPSISRSVLSQRDSEILVIRTDQTPLSPPPALKSDADIGPSTASSIKVETDFAATNAKQHTPKGRKNSFNPLHLFSAPLLLMQRASASRKQSKTRTEEAKDILPGLKDQLLEDHRTLLKRNHTAEALSRVSAILQEMKQSPQSSLRTTTGVIQSLKWRTFSDKWGAKRADKDHLVVPGGNDLFMPPPKKSLDQLSGARSYTSSVRNLLMGQQPSNSPAEQATYKVKRSASAETEEFLKVDISIRGGTSYLPSEARRIHTPPLPEEGADGKWRGFFFDYNAPKRLSNIALASGSTSPESVVSESQSTSTPLAKVKSGGYCKSKKTRRIGGGDWYDVKLAELGLGSASDWSQTVCAKEGEKRVNMDTLEVLSKGGWRRQEDHFDLTIPEHLPSSPLCPRNPRYWRVVKGRGSQFRGCWMHGVGVHNEHGNDKAKGKKEEDEEKREVEQKDDEDKEEGS